MSKAYKSFQGMTGMLLGAIVCLTVATNMAALEQAVQNTAYVIFFLALSHFGVCAGLYIESFDKEKEKDVPGT